jgi:hypothetical protein
MILPETRDIANNAKPESGHDIKWMLGIHILKVSENRMLRRTFGSKREEIVRVWRK